MVSKCWFYPPKSVVKRGFICYNVYKFYCLRTADRKVYI